MPIDVEELVGERRCYDMKGSPLCGAKAEGALLVDRLRHVTCPACVAVTNVPMTRLVRPGVA